MDSNRYARILSPVAACAFVVSFIVALSQHLTKPWQLLAFQYAFLLPAVVAFLWIHRNSNGRIAETFGETAETSGQMLEGATSRTNSEPTRAARNEPEGATANLKTGAAVAATTEDADGGRFAELRLPSIGLVLLFYLVVSVPLAWWGNQTPSSADESAYLFQARIFASGRLAAEAPPTAQPVDLRHPNEFFFVHHIITRDMWFGKYPPGWPALLALGVMLHVEWLVNPLLGLLLLWLTYRVALQCFGERIARLSAVLLLLSPVFFINCFGYYSHVFCGIALATATLFCLRSMRAWRARDVALCFAALAVAFLIRPYTAFCFAAVLGVAQLSSAWPRRGRLVWVLLMGACAALVAACALVAYNFALTGNPLRSAYAIYRGAESATEISYAPRSLLRNLRGLTPRALQATDLTLFPFIPLMALYALWRRRTGETFLLAAFAFALVFGYTIMTEPSDTTVGERYYFEALFAAAILAALGWSLIRERWRFSHAAVRLVAAALLLVQLVHFVRFSNDTYQRKAPFTKVQEAIRRSELRDGVVFMREGRRFPAKDFNPNEGDWRSAELFYLADPGPQRRAAVAERLGRARWYVFSYENGKAFLEERADEVSGASAPAASGAAIPASGAGASAAHGDAANQPRP